MTAPDLTKQQMEMLDEPIHVLGLDVRTTNALEHPGHPPVVRTIRELLQCAPEELLGIPTSVRRQCTRSIVRWRSADSTAPLENTSAPYEKNWSAVSYKSVVLRLGFDQR